MPWRPKPASRMPRGESLMAAKSVMVFFARSVAPTKIPSGFTTTDDARAARTKIRMLATVRRELADGDLSARGRAEDQRVLPVDRQIACVGIGTEARIDRAVLAEGLVERAVALELRDQHHRPIVDGG